MRKGSDNPSAGLILICFSQVKRHPSKQQSTPIDDFSPLDVATDLSRYRLKTPVCEGPKRKSQHLQTTTFFKKPQFLHKVTPTRRWWTANLDLMIFLEWCSLYTYLIRHDLNKWKFFPEKWRLQQKVSPLLRVALKGCYHWNKPRTFYLNLAIQSIHLWKSQGTKIYIPEKKFHSAKQKILKHKNNTNWKNHGGISILNYLVVSTPPSLVFPTHGNQFLTIPKNPSEPRRSWRW